MASQVEQNIINQQHWISRLRPLNLGVFLSQVYMFSSSPVVVTGFLIVSVAHADVTYVANRGDCLAGIARAHYPDATDHHFIVRANPSIRDPNHIEVGQKIHLPGLDDEQLLSEVDQAGCNAASLLNHKDEQNRITAHAETVTHQLTASVDPDDGQAHDEVAVTGRVVGAMAASAVAKAATPIAAQVVAKLTRAKAKGRQSAIQMDSKPTIQGTTPTPIDESQRTVPVQAIGHPTRSVAPMPATPRFAIDEPTSNTAQRHRASIPNRYVVNAIGARTTSADTALVQRPDQHFYAVPRSEQHGVVSHAPRSDEPTNSVSDQSVPVPTALEMELARDEAPKTQQVGNLFIDESLLVKTAAQSGDTQ